MLSGSGWRSSLRLPRSALTSPHLLSLVSSPWFVILACKLFKKMLLISVNSLNSVNIQPISARRQLPFLQEDAGKAQDAATAVASLESELEQATRREEQLRNSRAQCEYQLQQAGEVAQSQVSSTNPEPYPPRCLHLSAQQHQLGLF